ncbi:protein kinase domain-containing protein [Amycolatopsis australiensis]|nr:protein kinase [Amycolatopsis australiensis]
MENLPAGDLVPFRDGPLASSYLGRRGEVVVKVLPEPLDRRTRAAFERERAALAKLRGAPIRHVEQVRELPGGRPALVTPRCAESLADRVARSGPLDVPATVAVGAAVAEALAAAHGAGLAHGGVHPGNVLFAGDQPVVADFGVVLRRRFGREALAETGFLAPETLSRAVLDEASDRYGLGAVLYFCRTGQAPFRAAAGERAETLVLRVFDAPPPDLADVPPGLAGLVKRLLAKDPHERPDAETVVAELTALRQATGEPLLVLEPRREPPAPPGNRRRILAAVTACAAAAAVVAAAAALWPSGTGTPTPAPLPPPPPSTTGAADAVRIDLDEPADHEDFVTLTWHAPPNLDFAVLVTEAGQPSPRVIIAQRATSREIPVERGRGYCFRIQAASPRGTWQSQARPIRGAVC